VRLVQDGWSVRKAARHIGVEPSTVSRWLRRAMRWHPRTIPTESSRPHRHPHELPREIVQEILVIRRARRRCAEVIHQEVIRHGYAVSLSSVKRTLARHGMIRKRSPWKRWHQSPSRPEVIKPGDLVEVDTIHIVPELYVYTLLDVHSRWAHAHPSERINTYRSLAFVRSAQERFPARFDTIQSDHGSEFSTYFSEHIAVRGSTHRHSRVRQPNDNAHLERFNRTLQDECLRRIPRSLRRYQREIPEYLHYYNTERLHLALHYKTPQQVLRSY